MRPRLSEVLGALSAATDLAAGVPSGTSVRTSLVATRLGELLGQTGPELSATYYTSLLRHLGCTAFSHEAAWFAAGNDHDLLRTFEGIDAERSPRVVTRAVRRLSAGATLGDRVRAVARTLGDASAGARLSAAHCAQATALAEDLGMDRRVVLALGQIYERYAGRGSPSGLAGEEIALSARILHVASILEIHHRQGGRERARSALRDNAGQLLDPSICAAVLADMDVFWSVLELASTWDAYVEAEPDEPKRAEGGLDTIALAFARYADLKSPSFLGHSPAVAELAVAAAKEDGFDAHDLGVLRRAALLHDLGIVAIPNGIWEKPGPFDEAEREQARMHSFCTARVLARIPSFSDEARIAGMHHERCDGSGYPLGSAVVSADRAVRILACADAYRALVEDRPHRQALSAEAAANALSEEAREGRLCARAVDRVLGAAGHVPKSSSRPPAGLTEREIDVLVHLARGLTNKETGVALGIAARTVQHHIEHIYAKIGVSTRAAAALFAVRNDLVSDGARRNS